MRFNAAEEVVYDDAPKEYPLLPDGDYDFQVMKAEDTKSKAGNEMISMTLDVYDEAGKAHKVWDRLVSSPKALFRVKNFCEATNLVDKYKAGELSAADCEDMYGKCNIKTDPATGDYKAKNVVAFYHTEGTPPVAKPAKPVAEDDEFDTDIPF